MSEFREIAAFDIDDVLFHHAEGFCEVSNREYGTNLNICDYQDSWSLCWGITSQEAEDRRLSMIENGFFEGLEPVAGANEALARLAASGIGLVAVTKRRESLREATEAALDKYYEDLFASVFLATFFDKNGDKVVRKKSELCAIAGATSLTDDQHQTCLEVAQAGIDAIHYGDYGWSEPEQSHPKIIRAKTWQDVEEVLIARS